MPPSDSSDRSKTPEHPAAPNDIPIVGVAAVLVRHHRLLIGCALLAAALVASVTLLRPRTYAASASFMPQARNTAPAVAGLAAQFGVSLPTTDAAQSPPFYADLLKSREILGQVVDSSFTFMTDSGRVTTTLVELYGDADDPVARRRADAILELREAVNVQTSSRTGTIGFAVATVNPDLSLQVTRLLLQLLNDFNLETRQSQAAAERRFTEQRLEEVRRDLRAAEDRLQQFLQRNREFRAPGLQFEQDRLAREVGLQAQLFGAVAQAHEQARVEEVRDTPLLTVIERPELPVRPEPRRLLQKVILAGLVGAIIGILLALAREWWLASRLRYPAESSELVEELREAGGRVSPWSRRRRSSRDAAAT